MTQLHEKPQPTRRTTVEDVSDDESDVEDEKEHLLRRQYPIDSRFHQPTPAPWKRVALIAFVGVMFWLAFSMRKKAWERKNKVVFAKRYSEQFKFRPAASPIITEALKGGGTKLRGALPTPVMPEPTQEKKRKRRHSKRKGKKSGL
ncbi:hypothetical protein CPB85DRAFT_1328504 [Mucidula mucida]|nr:hypothetical protein CPB85DRAFT_1328504 [Mucidula mucida]